MENNNSSQTFIHKLDSDKKEGKMKILTFSLFLIAALVLGSVIGYIPSLFAGKTTAKNEQQNATKSVGIVDKKTFKDFAEGVLKEGGIDGEGTFHLERPGGESQNVYLTSTTVDLSKFIGKKVKVWGQTFSGEKAGWLMDVGLVEILK